MNHCVRKMHRRRRLECVQPVLEKLCTDLELQLLRAAVAALQEVGLMDYDVIEQVKQEWHRQTRPPRE